ncbi:MAG: helicase [Planctomycetes bacterium]|nr:helicase [Planctomycetota bacterium]
MKPEFIDNWNGNTLAKAIREHSAWLLENRKPPVDLAVATGYFNPGAFALVADVMEKLTGVRLLLGAEPERMAPRKTARQPRGERLRHEQFRKAIEVAESGLRDEINLLGFTEETETSLRRLVDFLRSGRVEVRRLENGFLHGKAFIFSGDEGVLSGSSNFTAAGLTTNRELNLGQYQPHVVGQVRDWFERQWGEAAPYDLASLYEARYREYEPYLIYLRVLWERYGPELSEEASPTGTIPLTTFQNDGLVRALRIIDEYNGVLIADGVGLGKSFLAGELIRRTALENRQRVLLVSPAALRDGPWRAFKNRFRMYLENISYEQLASDERLSREETRFRHLNDDPDAYAMVVVDEAHSLRNPDALRSRALRRLLQGTPPKKLVLLTATPVNNSLWDLYYLLTYFVKHDAVFADLGIPSLKQRFDSAMKEDPFTLKPDALFDLLDKVTVRRTRNFIRRHYPNERVRDAQGREMTIRFPKPHVQRLDYDLESVLPKFLRELRAALAPPSGRPKLTMARYVPSGYLKSGAPNFSQVALAGLLRSALLKRFESSVYAFARTCEGMVGKHDQFLEALDRGAVPTPELMREWGEDLASDEGFDDLAKEFGADKLAAYRAEDLKCDVKADREVLSGFAQRARTVSPTEDPKLEVLRKALAQIAERAEREGSNPSRKRDLRKVLIFSYYEDTIDWIEPYVRDIVASDKRLAPYRGRVASAAGQGARQGVSREDAVFGFVPESSEAPPGTEDRYDILIATDVLAEGLNLQQCRNIINYDLPWNPMRLVQRHGRIDRIGSKYEDVFIRCFFPTTQLDDLLNLEQGLRMKLAQAAASVGVESDPLFGGPTADLVFANTRREIESLKDERPELFENAGEDPASRSGEEYRQELRRALGTRREEITSLPWGAGSGFAGGERDGAFFCARVFDRVFVRFVPSGGGDIVRDTLQCLKQITCRPETKRNAPAARLQGIYSAWEQARQDIYQEWMRATDPANLQPKIRPLFRELAAHLRRDPPDGISQPDLEKALASVEAPWGLRYERELRPILESEMPPREKSKAIVEKVGELGLMPYHAPKPLEVIDADEVRLVCWMMVSRDRRTS